MISHIRGEVMSIEGDTVVVEAGGIGFTIKMSSASAIPGTVGKKVVVPVVMEITGGEPVLIGFCSAPERSDYSALVKNPGIGSATALRLLPVAGRVRAGDLSALDGIPGLGPFRRNKIAKWLKKTTAEAAGEGTTLTELRSALVALGMASGEARERAVKAVRRKPGAGLEQLIRLAVKG